MNHWKCDVLGCKSEAVGVGSALGLRAIGWFFQRGSGTLTPPLLLCPAHHKNKADLVKWHDCARSECPVCYANTQAEILQTLISSVTIREFL